MNAVATFRAVDVLRRDVRDFDGRRQRDERYRSCQSRSWRSTSRPSPVDAYSTTTPKSTQRHFSHSAALRAEPNTYFGRVLVRA